MNKKILWGAVAVATLIIVWSLVSDSPVPVYNDVRDYLASSPAAYNKPSTTTKTAPKTSTKPKPAPVTVTLDYEDAVELYAGRRFQFNEKCQATPSSATYKNGTTVMLDNRSAYGQTVSIDGKSYGLSGYGFKIITLSSSSLPHKVQVNCGGSMNIIDLLLQARISQ